LESEAVEQKNNRNPAPHSAGVCPIKHPKMTRTIPNGGGKKLNLLWLWMR
jgi:hypothetical protein